LFTFLEHDGVPWNNNNAEHAIKAFVRLRNIIGGAPGDANDNTINDNNPGGDVIQFALFMRLLAPPTPVTSFSGASAASIQRGHNASSR